MLRLLLKYLYIDWLISRQKRVDNIQCHVADITFVIQDWGMGTNGEHSCS